MRPSPCAWFFRLRRHPRRTCVQAAQAPTPCPRPPPLQRPHGGAHNRFRHDHGRVGPRAAAASGAGRPRADARQPRPGPEHRLVLCAPQRRRNGGGHPRAAGGGGRRGRRRQARAAGLVRVSAAAAGRASAGHRRGELAGRRQRAAATMRPAPCLLHLPSHCLPLRHPQEHGRHGGAGHGAAVGRPVFRAGAR